MVELCWDKLFGLRLMVETRPGNGYAHDEQHHRGGQNELVLPHIATSPSFGTNVPATTPAKPSLRR